MSDKAKTDPMEVAEELNGNVRGYSDLLLGAVRTLMSEGGWTEAQARRLVVHIATVPPGGAA